MASRPIDEKIVVMRLENSDFKNKAAETTGIFGKLKSVFSNFGNTRLDKVSREIDGIQRSANGVNMNGLSSAVDTISSRFTTLGVIATTTLTNITNKAVNAGSALVDSLTTQQVRDGFREYETKIGSIGTVLSNTEWAGTTLEDVKGALEELNTYADHTVYSFGQMTENIGRFTAAGVTIEDSTVAIKGLSNLAAASGSNVHQLNTAMYQMSQAMASGTMNLMDWNSLVNAGMGGKKTQDALLATAKAMGKNIDMSEGFRNSISDGWLTAEVFLETMKQFGKDESMTEAATAVRTFTGLMDSLKEGIGSGWAQTWEIIFGDFEQATRFWTAASNTIAPFFAKQAEARNKLLQDLANSGALEKVGEIVRNIGTPIITLFKAISNGFKQAFPPASTDGIMKVVSSIADLTSNFKMSAETVQNVTTIFRGLFSVFSTMFELIKILVGGVVGLIPGFDSAGGGVLSFIAKLAGIPIAINEYLKSGNLAEKITEKLKVVFGGIGSAISFLGQGFTNLSSIIGQTIGILSKGEFTNGAIQEDSMIIKGLFALREGFGSLFDFIGSINYSAIGSGFVSFFQGIGNTFVWIKDKIVGIIDFFKSIPQTIGDNQGWLLAGGGVAALGAVIWKVYETFKTVMKPFEAFGDILESGVGVVEGFTDVLDAASGALEAFTLGIHVKSLLTIAFAVGILALSLVALSTVDGRQIAVALGGLVAALAALVGALAIIHKQEIEGNVAAVASIVGLSVALAIMAVAIKNLSDLNPSQVTKGVVAIVAMLGALAGAITLMGKYGAGFAVSATQFVAVAVALGIMTFAIKQLIGLNPGELTKGLTTLGILLLELGIFIKLASGRNTQLAASATGLLATAGSILILVQAIKSISNIDPNNIMKGLLTIGSILLLIGTFTMSVNDKSLMSTATGLLILSGAINTLVIPILALGNAPTDVIAKGLTAIGIALFAFALTSEAMKATIPASIAVLLMAGALNALVIPIMALGRMTWESILKGVGGLALALLAFGGVAALLGMATPALIAFSVSALAIGVAFMALGVGVSLLAKSFLILATMTVGAVTVFVTAFGSLITGFVTLLPAITDLMMKITDAVVEVLVKMAPQVADAMGRLILAVLEKIKEYSPKILDLIGQTLLLVVGKIAEYAPQILSKFGDILVGMLSVVAEYVPIIIRTFLDFFLEMYGIVADYIPQFLAAGANIIIAIFEGLSSEIPRVVDAIADFVLTLVHTMSDTIRNDGYEFTNAVMELMGEVVLIMITAGISVIDALFGWIPGVTQATEAIGKNAQKHIDENFRAKELGTTKGTDFSGGMDGTSGLVKTAGENIAKAGLSGAESVDATPAGKFFSNGFVNGIGDSGILGRAVSAAKNLAQSAYLAIKEGLDIRSPSRLTHHLGEETGNGFANGVGSKNKSVMEAILGWKPEVTKAVTSVGKSTVAESTKSGTKAGTSLSKGISTGVSKSKKSVVNASKKVADDASKTFREAMENAQYKFEMEEIDSDQYIAELNKIKKEYSKHPKLVQEVSREIKKVEADALKHKQDLIKKEFEFSKKWINEKKNYNEMSLKEELAAWERVQARYKKGTEERKEADREVYRVKKDINAKLIAINEEYVEKVRQENADLVNDEVEQIDRYRNALSDRQQALASFMSIFDEVRTKTGEDAVTGSQLMNNLRDQNRVLSTWVNNINELSLKGASESLLEELRRLGPSAADEIAALTTLSSSELADYSEMWRVKHEIATNAAVAELDWLKKETDDSIQELRNNSAERLQGLKDEWMEKIKEIRTGTTDEFKGMDLTMEQVGKDVIKGLQNGLNNAKGPLIRDAKAIADEISTTIKNTLQIKSPSRVTTGLGEYAGEGLANGLKNSTKAVIERAKNLALSAKDAMSSLIEGFDLPEEDKEIKIRAVLDYDGFDNSKIFKMATLGLEPSLEYANINLSAIKQVKEQPTQLPTKSEENNDVKDLLDAVKSLVSRPNVTQLTVDGRKMAEVVSSHQHSTGSIGALTRGVVL